MMIIVSLVPGVFVLPAGAAAIVLSETLRRLFRPLPDPKRLLIMKRPLSDLGQVVLCQKEVGLVCQNHEQSDQMCLNYQIRALCCDE